MKERFIADYKTSEEVTDYLMVKSLAIKVGANHKQYLDLLLGDNSVEINGKKWDMMVLKEKKAKDVNAN